MPIHRAALPHRYTILYNTHKSRYLKFRRASAPQWRCQALHTLVLMHSWSRWGEEYSREWNVTKWKWRRIWLVRCHVRPVQCTVCIEFSPYRLALSLVCFFVTSFDLVTGQFPFFVLFVRLGGSEQKKKGGGGDVTPIHSVLPGLPQHVGA